MTDLELLREAVRRLRAGAVPGNPNPYARPATDATLAAWLNAHARDLESAAGNRSMLDSPGDTDMALAVARAYLAEDGGVSAPAGFTLRLIDVAEDARTSYGPDKAAEMFPGLPEHDYRFELVVSRTVAITLSADATAAHVAAYLAREGVEVPPR